QERLVRRVDSLSGQPAVTRNVRRCLSVEVNLAQKFLVLRLERRDGLVDAVVEVVLLDVRERGKNFRRAATLPVEIHSALRVEALASAVILAAVFVPEADGRVG